MQDEEVELEFQLDTNALIEAVEQFPLLYDSSLPEYHKLAVRNKAWIDVCESVFSNWHELHKSVKNDMVVEVQKKWRNVRNCLNREIRYRRTKQKHRPYIYYDKLKFLVDDINLSLETEEPDRKKCKKSKIFFKHRENEEVKLEVSLDDPPSPFDPVESSTNFYLLKEEKKSEVQSRHMADEPYDDDKYFLLSLLPAFRKMKQKDKMKARIEIMKVFCDIENEDRSKPDDPLSESEV